jgi:hypothetical protein
MINNFLKSLLSIFEKEKDVEHYDVMSYEDVIRYVIDNKTDDTKKAAVFGKQNNGKWIISQFFLNESGTFIKNKSNILHGRKVSVQKIDTELEELFGKNDMIIIE